METPSRPSEGFVKLSSAVASSSSSGLPCLPLLSYDCSQVLRFCSVRMPAFTCCYHTMVNQAHLANHHLITHSYIYCLYVPAISADLLCPTREFKRPRNIFPPPVWILLTSGILSCFSRVFLGVSHLRSRSHMFSALLA